MLKYSKCCFYSLTLSNFVYWHHSLMIPQYHRQFDVFIVAVCGSAVSPGMPHELTFLTLWDAWYGHTQHQVENSGIGSIEKLPGNNRGTTAEVTKPAINVHKTHWNFSWHLMQQSGSAIMSLPQLHNTNTLLPDSVAESLASSTCSRSPSINSTSVDRSVPSAVTV